MARYESKSLQVHPNNEQMTIQEMERFGWELKNAQDVKTKDSHLESIGDSIYSVTETERYIKLLFQRDVESEKYSLWKKGETLYDEIKELRRTSKDYDFSFSIWPTFYSKWPYIGLAVAVFIFSGILWFVFRGVNPLVCMVVSAVLIGGGIIAYRLFVLRPKKVAEHEEFAAKRAERRKVLASKEAELRSLGL